MEFVLVDKYDNINNRAEISEGVDAKDYFMKIKQINEESFDQLWKVMTIEQYDRIMNQSLRNNSSRQIEWWKEEDGILDIEKS
jgi:hypothetical protein|tara:strand:+ start:269 stop:517 length:249 start_codon:yes stop_codon:yes gene_type:complete